MKFDFVVKDCTDFTYDDGYNIKLKEILLKDCLYKIDNNYIEIEDRYIEERVGFSIIDKILILFLDDRSFVSNNYGETKLSGDIVYSVGEWVIKRIIE